MVTVRAKLLDLTEPLVALTLGGLAMQNAIEITTRYRGTPRLPRGFGPDTYLYAVGTLLLIVAVLAAYTYVRRLMAGAYTVHATEPDEPMKGTSESAEATASPEIRSGLPGLADSLMTSTNPLVKVAMMVLLLCGFVAAMRPIGFFIAAGLFLLFAGLLMGFRSVWRPSAFAILTTLILYFVFVELLSMRLP